MISVIDVEASGFGFDSYPIEVGVVTHSNQRLCFLIYPFSDWNHWDDNAESVHGISRHVLLDRGKHPVEVCGELNLLLRDTTVYSDAWVHDYDWINKLFYRAKIKMEFRVSPIESVATEEQLIAWDATKKLVIDQLGLVRHRASSDALIIQKTFHETALIEQSSIVDTPIVDTPIVTTPIVATPASF